MAVRDRGPQPSAHAGQPPDQTRVASPRCAAPAPPRRNHDERRGGRDRHDEGPRDGEERDDRARAATRATHAAADTSVSVIADPATTDTGTARPIRSSRAWASSTLSASPMRPASTMLKRAATATGASSARSGGAHDAGWIAPSITCQPIAFSGSGRSCMAAATVRSAHAWADRGPRRSTTPAARRRSRAPPPRRPRPLRTLGAPAGRRRARRGQLASAPPPHRFAS